MASVILVAVGVPLGIIAVYFLATRSPDRMQKWMPWSYGLIALLQAVPIAQGVRTGSYRVSFWVAVSMLVLTLVLLAMHFREARPRQVGTEQR